MTIAVRRHFKYVVKDEYGNIISNARVNLYQPGTTNTFLGTAYTTLSGGTTTTNPFTSNTQGEIEAWFDTPQALDIEISDNTDTALRAGYSTPISFSTFTEYGLVGIGLENTSGNLATIDAGDSASAGSSALAAKADHQHTYTTLPNAHGNASHTSTFSVNPHGAADHTNITRFMFFPVEDGVVLDGGTLASRGTAPNIIRVITLADAATSGASWAFVLPDDYVTNSSLTYEIYHAGQTTTSGSVRWEVNMHVIAEGVSIVTAQGAAAFTGQAPTTADLLVIEAGTSLGVTGSAGDLIRLNVRRIGGDAADNYAASTSLIGLKVSYTANQ